MAKQNKPKPPMHRMPDGKMMRGKRHPAPPKKAAKGKAY